MHAESPRMSCPVSHLPGVRGGPVLRPAEGALPRPHTRGQPDSCALAERLPEEPAGRPVSRLSRSFCWMYPELSPTRPRRWCSRVGFAGIQVTDAAKPPPSGGGSAIGMNGRMPGGPIARRRPAPAGGKGPQAVAAGDRSGAEPESMRRRSRGALIPDTEAENDCFLGWTSPRHGVTSGHGKETPCIQSRVR